jgi:hypothetical protein
MGSIPFQIPNNTTIVPITISSAKTVQLPLASQNAGRFLILKDYLGGCSGTNVLCISTISNDRFENSFKDNLLFSNEPYGAWKFNNDGISQWYLSEIYTNAISTTLYTYKQSNIITENLYINWDGSTYDAANSNWPDLQGNVHLSTGLGTATPTTARDLNLSNAPNYGTGQRNKLMRAFTPIAPNLLYSSFTWEYWFYNAPTLDGVLLAQLKNPNVVSTLGSINQYSLITGNQIRAGYFSEPRSSPFLTISYTANQWNHVVIVQQTSTLSGYLNGVLNTTASGRTYVPSSFGFGDSYLLVGQGNVGTTSGNVAGYLGTSQTCPTTFGAIRFYTSTFGAAQVRQNFNAFALRYGRNNI